MEIRKHVAAGALAGALSVGGVAGAVLLQPAAAVQEEDGTTTTVDEGGGTATEAEHDRARHHRHGLEMFDLVAEVLGIPVQDVRTALEEGQTIAELAEANGVEAAEITDALVDAGTERLEAQIEALPERADVLVNRTFDEMGERGFDRRGRVGPGAHDESPRDGGDTGDDTDDAPAEDAGD